MEERGARRFSLFWPRPLFEDLGGSEIEAKRVQGQEGGVEGKQSLVGSQTGRPLCINGVWR